jgi:hypothetical protein
MHHETAASERRNRKRTLKGQALELTLTFDDSGGRRQSIQATLADNSDKGLGIRTRVPMAVDRVVMIKPSAGLQESGMRLPVKATVAWCRPLAGGFYRIGLGCTLDDYPPEQEALPDAVAVDEDFYDLLQISPKAHNETIHRVYRFLAQRYHPDNIETGNEELFKKLKRAFDVLTDPEQRNAYDLQSKAHRTARWKIFENTEASTGVNGERRKRRGILMALYRKRLLEQEAPTLSAFDMEDLLCVPREHLEFSFWYLKERGFVGRADNNRFQITVAGVEEAERLENEFGSTERLLPAHTGA